MKVSGIYRGRREKNNHELTVEVERFKNEITNLHSEGISTKDSSFRAEYVEYITWTAQDPLSQSHAIATPRIKKANTDPTDLKLPA